MYVYTILLAVECQTPVRQYIHSVIGCKTALVSYIRPYCKYETKKKRRKRPDVVRGDRMWSGQYCSADPRCPTAVSTTSLSPCRCMYMSIL